MKLALGTVQFGLDYGVANQSGRISFSDAKTIIEQSAISGIDTLDTAIAYGASETTLGHVRTFNCDCINMSVDVSTNALSIIIPTRLKPSSP